ncbi:unnamed protein product [Lactuca saligna]|uniref:P-type ATPase C-terminal domain-containing protein n=1 Tax=Lactuca saligna TaxID=75948 RepID=A0AA35ZQ98_LACSI|nr:unnamed protein product [Lactuca saligna]
MAEALDNQVKNKVFIKVLLAKLCEGTSEVNANNGTISGVLVTVGYLARVGAFVKRKCIPELMPRTVEALLDGAAATKREVSVATVGQCVMSSDVAMAQFRFLIPILLVPGHWNYQRMGYMILYNFYRNTVFVLVLFWQLLLFISLQSKKHSFSNFYNSIQDVDMLYNTLSLDKVEAPEDLVIIGPPSLVKVTTYLLCKTLLAEFIFHSSSRN